MNIIKEYAGINPSAVTIPEHLFNKAIALYHQEEYSQSINLIESIFKMKPACIHKGKYNLWDLFALYGWNLVFLKSMVELENWRMLIFGGYFSEDAPNELIPESVKTVCQPTSPHTSPLVSSGIPVSRSATRQFDLC